MATILSRFRSASATIFADSRVLADASAQLARDAHAAVDVHESTVSHVDLNATHLPGRTLAGESIVASLGSAGKRFWGRTDVPYERWRVFELGKLRLWTGRFAGEWRVAQERSDDGYGSNWRTRVDTEGPPVDATLERYAVSDRDGSIVLAPTLPNRPLVFRPQVPLYLPENEMITIFVEIPLWVACCAVNPLRELTEVGLERLSDTWFGPTNREGELCYACRSRYAIDVSYLPLSPFRATCAITLANRTDSALRLERLRLRTESLGLFHAADGRLWTHDIIFERARNSGLIAMQVRPGVPLGANDAETIAQPRRQQNANLVMKALSHFFDS